VNRRARRKATASQSKKLRNRQLLTPETTGLSLFQLQQLQQMVGEAKKCFELREDKRVEELCRNCLYLFPNYATPHAILGELAMRLHRYEVAIVHYKKSLEILPDVPDRWIKYGQALLSAQKIGQAKTAFDRAVKLAPDNFNALEASARILAISGKTTEALRKFERLITLYPDVGSTYYYLSQYVHFKSGDKYEIWFKRLLDQVENFSDISDAANAHFALGKYLEDLSDYESSYKNFMKANKLIHNKFSNGGPNNKPFGLGDIKRAFPVGGDWVSAEIKVSDTVVPIFIVGMPRSGTTLIEQIVSSLDGVYGAGELKNISEAGIRLASAFPGKEPFLTSEDPDFEKIIYALGVEAKHVEQLMQRLQLEAVRIIDKMPQNFMNIGVIHLLFPNARIIHCRRDPIDTCLSNFKTSFSGKLNFTSDMRELGEYYVQYEEIMEHWHNALPGRILDVQYEEVVADLEGQARRIINYCGLEWDPVCLKFYKNKRAVSTASSNQVRQPIYNSSVGQKDRYGDLIDPLLKALAPVL